MKSYLAPLAGLSIAGIVLLAAPAAAHVSPDKSEVPAGGFTAVTLTVGHGCEASPTTAVAVQVPDAILDVTPEVKPGWDVEVETEALAEPVEGGHGEQISERDAVVTFTAQPGNELPDGFRTGFTLGFQAPDTPGEPLFFKTIQTCVEGETPWVEEYTGEGEEPETPSPVVFVVASSGASHGAEEPVDDTADEPVDDATDDPADDATDATDDTAAEEEPELAAVPPSAGDDADNDSSTGIAVAGLVAGLLGLALGGTALVRTRRAA